MATARCSHAYLFSGRGGERRGAMLILIGLMLTILVVMCAFSIDVAYMHLVRTELRTSTDAAARAASEALARTQSVDEARLAAQQIAQRNRVAGEPLQLEGEDIIFGRATRDSAGIFQVSVVGDPALLNAVRVHGRRTADTLNGPVPLFMGTLLGRETFEPQLSSTATSLVRDIALIVDRSGSMNGQKLDDLKSAIEVFLGILGSTFSEKRVSLQSYATEATKDVDLTQDFELIRTSVQALVADGYTAIGQGLQLGTDSLEWDAGARVHAEKTIVLMTDGLENRTPLAMSVLPTVQARHQTIHTVTFGTGADQALMRELAEQTGGTHRHADTGEDLEQAFREIAHTLAVVFVQ